MNQDSERRDPGARRVSVSTLVEVVGNVPGIPVFEAEALDVSARGMHLRTAYLPHEGDPLVCRFENAGREILVEGVVAWRQEHSRGGEFGVQFTALDSKSVESLRDLCGEVHAERPDAGASAGPVGSRVRLHIDGLGSPMKARVKEGSSARLQVGSSLEFLKLGRKLELEDLERGARREAQIDGVSVIVDPSTRVPQLVVALRFEGSDEVTPSPQHRDVGPAQPGARRLDLPASHVTTDGPPPVEAAPARRSGPPALPPEDAIESDDERDNDPEMRGKVAQIAERAGERAKVAGAVLAQASSSAAKGALGLFQVAVARFGKARGEQRRTTSPKRVIPPTKPRLRSQHGPNPSEVIPGLTKLRLSRKSALMLGAAALVTGTAFSLLLRGGETREPVAAAPAEQTVQAEAMASAAPATDGAVTANVPLFGPTPLATTEPAPLAPGPGERALEAAEKADALALSPARASDLEWAEEDGTAPSRKTEREEKSDASDSKDVARPEDVAPWGRGKVKEPTIHRLRLDSPGAALRGSAESTGFSVIVPSRKVMEAAGGIAKRDARIARIRATNTPVGAQIAIQFKGPVPAYKVRLRKDYVEFLISAPGTETASSTSTSSSAKSKSATSKPVR